MDIYLSHALTLAILHSLWQGLIIISCVYLLVRNDIIRKPAHIYGISMLGLFLLFGLFVASCVHFYEFRSIEPLHASFTSNQVFSSPEMFPSEGKPTLAIENIVFLIWITGALFFLLRLGFGSYALYRINASAQTVSDEWMNRFLVICSNCGLSRNVNFKASVLTTVPMVVGLIRPVVTVPLIYFNQMTVEELESILVHEVMHIKRRDFFFNMIQHLLESVLFFNPATWWLSTQIRRNREFSCDDQVQQHIQTSKPYLKALYKVAYHTYHSHHASIALINNKKELTMRVKRMLNHSREDLVYRPVVSLTALAAMVFLFFSFQSVDPYFSITDRHDQSTLAAALDVQDAGITSEEDNYNLVELAPAISLRASLPEDIEREEFEVIGATTNFYRTGVAPPFSKTTADVDLSASPRSDPFDEKNAATFPYEHNPLVAEMFLDTTPSNARIRELERQLEAKSEELEELAEKLSEEMEESVELEADRMEELSEKLEAILEPRLDALDDELYEEDMERMEELGEELEELMERRMEEWEEKMEEDFLEELEDKLDNLSDQLEEMVEEGETESNRQAIEQTRREMEEVQRKLEVELHDLHKAQDELLNDPRVKSIHEEMEALSRKISDKHRPHGEIWTDEAKALQEEINMIQREIEKKISGMASNLSKQVSEKAQEVERLAMELHEERQKQKRKEKN